MGNEFYALAVGFGFIKEALKEREETKSWQGGKGREGGEGEADKEEKVEEGGGSEAAKKEKAEEDDIIAIAWRVEYDLTRYIE